MKGWYNMFLSVISQKAVAWAERNLNLESWQIQGNTIAIDSRYMPDITDGMEDDGLSSGDDYEVL
jgi:hypothetical protein